MVTVKVMHISTENISQTMTDQANITITNKYKVAYGLSRSSVSKLQQIAMSKTVNLKMYAKLSTHFPVCHR